MIAIQLNQRQQAALEAYRQALTARAKPCCDNICDGCAPRGARARAFQAGVPVTKLNEVLMADLANKKLLNAGDREVLERISKIESKFSPTAHT